MTYEQKRQKLDQRIKNMAKVESDVCYISDGIVNIESWRQQTIRPLFVGKEAYDSEGRKHWDYADWLNKNPEDAFNATPRTWPTTACISYSLQNGFLDFNSLHAIRRNQEVIEAIKLIAVINLGKYGAEKTTAWPRLNNLYNRNKDILHEQIELCQPNVVIGWSTLNFFRQDAQFKKRFGEIEATNQDAVESWVSKGVLYIDAYHPAYVSVTPQRYVDSVIRAVKEHIGTINKNLPNM